jgi:uncharacterized protein
MTHFSCIQNYWTSPDWLGKRMLFLSGPRQVGKTTLVHSALLKKPELYFNWDAPKVRSAYRKDPEFFFSGHIQPDDWVCFDEIHKRARWKDILKGVYDQYRNAFHLVVTGSALLETFKKSGDSLVGRYFTTHLFPINVGDFRQGDFHHFTSANDLIAATLDAKENNVVQELLLLSGFPEPFYHGKVEFWKRWSVQHRELIVSQDMRDLTRIQDLDKIEGLLELLVPNIGSQVSHSSLAKDLEVAHTTVKTWLSQLEKVQLIFPVRPYSKKLRNVFKKEVKWYFTDWCSAKGNQFENYVASLLHRAVVLWKDRWGENFQLHYVSTHQGAEVDFLIVLDGKPFLLIEAKTGKPDTHPHYYHFAEQLQVPCLIVTPEPGYARKIPCQNVKAQLVQISVSKLGQVLP